MDVLIYEGQGWKFTSPEGSDSLHITSTGVGLDKTVAVDLANAILAWAKE
jgi:hypothetical protein